MNKTNCQKDGGNFHKYETKCGIRKEQNVKSVTQIDIKRSEIGLRWGLMT